nr:sarcosine oxidase subunit gamma family protein [Roseomonas rosulenta]
MGRRGRLDALTQAIQGAFGVALPGPGETSTGADATAIWIQPAAWLIMAPRGTEAALAARAAVAFAGIAAVEDQSHGRTVIAVSGPAACAVLARGCRIDLHPRAFGPGRAAMTQIAHVSCLVHQVHASPSFELTVFSTLAEHVFHWLLEAGAEAGVRIG